jgi:hypothetical protein
MLTPSIPIYRPRGKRPRRMPPPRRVALTLVSAAYDSRHRLD